MPPETPGPKGRPGRRAQSVWNRARHVDFRSRHRDAETARIAAVFAQLITTEDGKNARLGSMHVSGERRCQELERFVEASAIGWVNYLYGDRKAADALYSKLYFAFGQPASNDFGVVLPTLIRMAERARERGKA